MEKEKGKRQQEILTKFNKDILGGIKGHLFEVLSHQDLHWVLVPVIGDVLAHKVGLWTQEDKAISPNPNTSTSHS